MSATRVGIQIELYSPSQNNYSPGKLMAAEDSHCRSRPTSVRDIKKYSMHATCYKERYASTWGRSLKLTKPINHLIHLPMESYFCFISVSSREWVYNVVRFNKNFLFFTKIASILVCVIKTSEVMHRLYNQKGLILELLVLTIIDRCRG